MRLKSNKEKRRRMKALRRATRKRRQSGDISRADALSIRIATRTNAAGVNARLDALQETAAEDGVVVQDAGDGGKDWDGFFDALFSNFADFATQMLPTLLQCVAAPTPASDDE